MERPGSTLEVILALTLGSECFLFQIRSRFWPFVLRVFFEADKHADEEYNWVKGYPVYPPRTHASLALSLSRSQGRLQTPSACMCAGTVADFFMHF